MKLFVSPHNDDECLFGAFTLLREKPLVVVVFDGYVQGNRGHAVTWQQRREETMTACQILGVQCEFLGFRDDRPPACEDIASELLRRYQGMTVWAPTWEADGHAQHNMVAVACDAMLVKDRYLTYTRLGKSRKGTEVKPTGAMVLKKLQALAQYKTQIEIDALGCWPHFMDLREYTA